MIFQQVDCEIPRSLEPAGDERRLSKYFYGDVASGNGSPAEGKREYSVRQLVDRVTRTIADWGKEDGYFATARGRRPVLRRADDALPEPVRVVQLAGLVQRGAVPPLRDQRPGQQLPMGRGDARRSPGRTAPTSSRRPRPASSRASATTWKGSCGWPRARPCSSSSARGPAPTSRPSAPARRSSPAAASPRGPSASCGSMTPSPASSSRAARPAGPPRCRPSSAGTPISSSSSSARSTRRRRPRRSSAPATRPISTAPPTAR